MFIHIAFQCHRNPLWQGRYIFTSSFYRKLRKVKESDYSYIAETKFNSDSLILSLVLFSMYLLCKA